MYSSADWSVTPRPIYPADGRKIPDIYTAARGARATARPPSSAPFPFFNFWGPTADIRSSEWIAEASQRVDRVACADAAARLPAAPRLQPAAARPRRSEDPRRRPRDRRDLRDADRALPRARDARSSCCRSTASPPVTRHGAHQPGAARSGAACGPRRARARKRSTPARARRSRSPTTRSLTSTCANRRASPT